MNTQWLLYFIVWLLAAASTAGSLFFSEVMLYPPCVLCWYQRICMYPLVVILCVGMFPLDSKVVRYAMPLSILGWVIAFYHLLLYYKIVPETLSPCRSGVSCATVFFEWFGFITIPSLSFMAFTLINLLLWQIYRRSSHEK